MPVRLPLSRDPDVDVFAVDDRSVQLTYRGIPGPVEVAVGSRKLAVDSGSGAAVIEIDELAPDTAHEIEVTASDTRHRLSAHTRSSIGHTSFRFATISDLHIGADTFGHFPASRDDTGPYAFRCALAAAHEAAAWGAELLVIKGDITEYATNAHWSEAARFIEQLTIPAVATPGNHDVWKTGEKGPTEAFAELGLSHEPVLVDDRPGVRLVIGDTARPAKGTGSLRQIGSEILDAVRSSDRPVWLGIHHNIQRTPVAWFWPPGITSTDAGPVVSELAATDPAIFISSGHTHRNRSHRLGPDRSVAFTEVASTSDYPGSWAGYEVSSSHIRQTVRRIADPEVVAWTEHTRRAVGGVWPRWSAGRLDDRCVDLAF